METVQYRDYIFRHNPRTITVSRQNATASHFCPGRGEVVQRLGGRGRIVKCAGSFFAASFEEAASQLEEFRRAVDREGPGTLFIPGVAPFLAHLMEFVFEASGDGKVIPYTMVFVEAEVEA